MYLYTTHPILADHFITELEYPHLFKKLFPMYPFTVGHLQVTESLIW